jgi:hypothetical protein
MIRWNFVSTRVDTLWICSGRTAKEIIVGAAIKCIEPNSGRLTRLMRMTESGTTRYFRRLLPMLEKLCSCDLFGHRFTIPCSPVDYLNAEYGENKWISPLEKNYTWVNMRYHSMWNDISWMYATRLYTRLGHLRTDRFAIDWISKHFNYSISSIPSFLNILPNETVTLPPLKTKLVYVSPVKRKKL